MVSISRVEKFQLHHKLGVNASEYGNLSLFRLKRAGFCLSVCIWLLLCQFAEAALPRTTTYSYDPATNLIKTIDGPRTDVSDVTFLDYDPGNGNLIRVTNPLGHITEIKDHDFSGRPKKIIDPNGLVVELEYHPRGWISSRTVNGNRTDFIYDHVGQLTQINLPNGFEVYYSYDQAHRLINIQDNLGNSIFYTLDAMGNRLKEDVKDHSGVLVRKLEGEYDQLSRLLLAVGGENQLTRYSYDENGNVTAQTDPRNTGTSRSAALLINPAGTDNSTLNVFDALNRLIRSTNIQSLGSGIDDVSTSYSYNSLGYLEQVTDPNGLQTQYNYNAFGDVLQKQSPDTGITRYQYDSAGNLIQQTDARGVNIRFQYDALNRLRLVDYSDDIHDVVFSYDEGTNGIGRLTTVQDAAGITTYQYDIQGQLTEVEQTLGENTSRIQYDYDVNGNVTALTYPSGHAVHYGRDLAGQITAVHVDINGQIFPLAEDIVWLPYGPLRQIRYGNGLLQQAQFDLSGRMISSDAGEVSSQLYEYDLSDNLEQLKDELDIGRSQRFEYDALERLSFEEGSYGEQAFDYDHSGNRTRRITTDLEANEQVQKYIYGPNSHHLIQVEPHSLREYDAMGNTLSSHDGRNTYHYNPAGRLDAFYLDGGLEAEYFYNGFGERAQKKLKRLTQNFHYNGNGQLLAKQQFQKKRKTASYDTVWLNGIAIAQIRTQSKGKGKKSTTEILYLHNDHLGTPRLATNQEQKIVWRWDSDAFGTKHADSNPDKDKTETEINLRFPGQYFDQESGLHYNYQRYYDPSVGRYITSDPIGLAGGINTYVYVGNSPLKWNDYLGLVKQNPNTPTSGGSGPGQWFGGSTVGGTWGGGGMGGRLGPIKRNIAPAKRASNVTVFGSNPDYIRLSDKLGARRFYVPNKIWDKMTPSQRWTANCKFMDRTISRGDKITFSNSAHDAQPGTIFFKELNYLRRKGLNISDDGFSALP